MLHADTNMKEVAGADATTSCSIAAHEKNGTMLPDVLYGYQLLDTVGEGGSATVKAARNIRTNTLIAVKILRKADAVAAAAAVASSTEGAYAAAKRAQFDALRKEIMIHSSMKHHNIIELLDAAEDRSHFYILMELAIAGELFDRIEPDFGVPLDLAHFYYSQLVRGMQYMHHHGVAHRDLKPENLLLHRDGNLRITDFGLATVFMHRGRRRTLTTPCGTPPYVAPEVHELSYQGDAADIWSSGVILYVLLTGNTPWGEPTRHDPDFVYYRNHFPARLHYEPWSTLDRDVSSLLLGVLCIDPSRRLTIPDILASRWLRKHNPLLTEDGRCVDPRLLAGRIQRTIEYASQLSQQQRSQLPASQRYTGTTSNVVPATITSNKETTDIEPPASARHTPIAASQMEPLQTVEDARATLLHTLVSYSQPNDIRSDDPSFLVDQYSTELLSLSQQPQNLGYQSMANVAVLRNEVSSFDSQQTEASQNDPQSQILSQSLSESSMSQQLPLEISDKNSRAFDLVTATTHLTRAFIRGTTVQQALDVMIETFENFLVPFKISQRGRSFSKIMFSTVDKRKCQLHGQVTIQILPSNQAGKDTTYHNDVDNILMMRFLKSKGDPLEFKRFYRTVLNAAAEHLNVV